MRVKLKTAVCFYSMEEEETQIKFCRTMICLLRSKQQQHLESTEEERRRRHGGRERSECEDRDQFAEQTSPSVIIHQSPQVQPVPTQLISTLRLKSLEEKMRRVRKHTWLIHFFVILEWLRFLFSIHVYLSCCRLLLLQRWSSMTPLCAVCVSRNKPHWPWKLLSGGRRHNCRSRHWKGRLNTLEA